jgi:hypothetical protein
MPGSDEQRAAPLQCPEPCPAGCEETRGGGGRAGRAPHQVDAHGRVIQALHDATGATARTVTSATEHAGQLYLGSLAPDLRAIPVLDLSRVQRAPSQ